MQVKIAFVDDSAHALQHWSALPAQPDTHWVLVACAPKITRRASRWGNRSTLDKWRNKWARNLFDDLLARSQHLRQGTVSTQVAEAALQQITMQLHAEHPGAEFMDWRRPKAISAPPDATPHTGGRLTTALAGLFGLCLTLGLD
ncbi:hypothetical protein GCM10027082_42390 [Comamonas humi]